MDSLTDKAVFVVSTRAMKLLHGNLVKTLALKMSWSEDLHSVFVYTNNLIKACQTNAIC